jgi:hypothetical protein
MPTKPLETVIYRELQIARAEKFLRVATPLFQELVNYGSNVLIRCASSSIHGENEDLAALDLYRNILEMTDAFEVMIAACCATPTVPIIRSSFEALLSLEYILESKTTYVQRSLSWLLVYVHKRIALYEMVLVDSSRGKEFQASIKKDKWIQDLPTLPQDQVHKAIDNLQKLVRRDQFSDIEKEYRTFEKPPHWYRLFGGPASIQQLAYKLNRHSQYDYLYRNWSTIAHAHDFSKFIAVDSAGESGIRGIRDVGPLQEVSMFAAEIILEATRRMLLEFRPGEDYARYYEAEVRDKFRQVIFRKDFFS